MPLEGGKRRKAKKGKKPPPKPSQTGKKPPPRPQKGADLKLKDPHALYPRGEFRDTRPLLRQDPENPYQYYRSSIVPRAMPVQGKYTVLDRIKDPISAKDAWIDPTILGTKVLEEAVRARRKTSASDKGKKDTHVLVLEKQKTGKKWTQHTKQWATKNPDKYEGDAYEWEPEEVVLELNEKLKASRSKAPGVKKQVPAEGTLEELAKVAEPSASTTAKGKEKDKPPEPTPEATPSTDFPKKPPRRKDKPALEGLADITEVKEEMEAGMRRKRKTPKSRGGGVAGNSESVIGPSVYDPRSRIPKDYRRWNDPYIRYSANSIPKSWIVENTSQPVGSNYLYTQYDPAVLIGEQMKKNTQDIRRRRARGEALIPRPDEYHPFNMKL